VWRGQSESFFSFMFAVCEESRPIRLTLDDQVRRTEAASSLLQRGFSFVSSFFLVVLVHRRQSWVLSDSSDRGGAHEAESVGMMVLLALAEYVDATADPSPSDFLEMELLLRIYTLAQQIQTLRFI
jgi:hypothetical protein